MIDLDALRDRLIADAVAAPVRNPAFFCRAATTATSADLDRHTRSRAEVYQDDLSVTAVDTENTVRAATDLWKTYCDDRSGSFRMIGFISKAARELLQSDGREMVLRVWRDDPGREILRWRFLSLMLPSAILIAAATPDNIAPPESVRLLNRSIAPAGEVAHLHLHHAALIPFEDLWAALVGKALVTPSTLVSSLINLKARCPGLHQGKCPVDPPNRTQRSVQGARHMSEWADLLRQALIARRVLDWHSWHGGTPLQQCKCCNAEAWQNALRFFLQGRTKPFALSATPYPWPNELLLRTRRYRSYSHRLRPDHVNDPVIGEAAAERAMLTRAFSYLQPDAASPDDLYEILFLQYLRVKTAVFRMLVDSPGRHGLDGFMEHFSQIKIYARHAEERRPRELHQPPLQVAAIEYRVAPDAWLKIWRWDEPSRFPLKKRRRDSAEVAWLVHFKRKRTDGRLPTFGDSVRDLECDGQQIARAIAANPATLQILRGIDLAGAERDQPLWVSAQTLRRVRQLSRVVAGRRVNPALEPLRMTLHVGEDFAYPTSGLRAIAEPFHWRLLERGDRLAHAIALTIDPEKWMHRRTSKDVTVMRLERLLDLGFLAAYAPNRNAAAEEWLLQRIVEIVSGVWPGDASIQHLVRDVEGFWTLLGTEVPRSLMRLRSPDDFPDRPKRWLYAYLWNRRTQERAQEKLVIRISDLEEELNLITMARERIVRDLARWQICIETNPSSNLVIGSLDSIAAQEFLHRRPTGVAEDGRDTLTWTISADDPITFSTTLADEYAYAWAGMVLRKHESFDPAYARALLDEAAATSMRMRFTIAQGTLESRGDVMYREGRRRIS